MLIKEYEKESNQSRNYLNFQSEQTLDLKNSYKTPKDFRLARKST